MTRSFRFPRLTLFGALFLGLVFAVLVSGPAGAASSEEARLFNLAAHDKNHGAVQQLLAKGVSPNVPVGRFNDGQTAVHAAAEGGAVRNLAALLQAGGNPNARERDGNTPLHLSSRGSFSGHVDAVRVLLQRGADLHRPNALGETPLHVAVYGDVGAAHSDIIKALLVAGARPETVDGNGLTALQRFARHSGDRGEIVTLLLRAGADPEQKDSRGDAPLHAAIKEGGSNGKPAVVEALLAGGANPCVQDARGYTPYQMSSAMQRIHQALSRSGGGDLDCDKSSMVYGEGSGSGAPSEMTKQGQEGQTGESRAALKPFGPNWIIAENQPCQASNHWPLPGETYTWSGGCVDGKVSGEGRGVFHLPDGGKDVYEGRMRDGKHHGQGIFTWAKGARFEGEWRYNKPHGYGIYTDAAGARFEGKWHNGCYKAGSRKIWINASDEECGF